MTLEQTRQWMVRNHARLIANAVDEIRRKLEAQGMDADPNVLRELVSKHVDDSLPPETRLFLMDTNGQQH